MTPLKAARERAELAVIYPETVRCSVIDTADLRLILAALDEQEWREGWVLVPRIPTPEMVDAMRLCTIRNSRPADPASPFESPFTCAVDAASLPAPPVEVKG